jgi:hypothetical protein
MMVCKRKLLFLTILSSLFFSAKTQGLEYEISAGPQLTKATITDYTIGIVGTQKPKNNRLLPGYTVAISVRKPNGMIQPGLQLKTDMVRHNVYLPLQFPSDGQDGMAKFKSRWDNIYSTFRLGVGGNLRFNLNSLYLQPGVSYLLEISAETKHQVYCASCDTKEDVEGEEYSSGSGAAGELQAGFRFGKPENKKYGIALGIQYLFKTQNYTFETFLHQWEIRPIDYHISFHYRFS